jgi:hypothetical protein
MPSARGAASPGRCHDADLTTDTIVPIGLADKLDFDMAVWAA